MLFIYRVLINLVFILSPLIIFIRILKKKENPKRFKEKLGFFSNERGKGKLIWFHGASVGEIKSIIPLIEKLEKNKQFSKILTTSNTLSSSKIFQQYKFKKTIHQFFPIDTNLLSESFLNYWRPSLALFVDSEIWPNMFLNLKKKKIPTVLINGRITKKTFAKWSLLPKFSQKIFSIFSLCLSSNKETKKFLSKLGAKKIKFFGNLKFSQSENENTKTNDNLKKFFNSKKVWCASSTHRDEEIFCGKVHNELKKKYKNLVTIIIPRHIERVELIKSQLEKLKLNVQLHESKKKINNNIDIYIVDSYGKTKSFYNYCKNVFLGGSLISHGGQNPLEAARYGCNILHGAYVDNFREIYNFLKLNKISTKVSNKKEMYNLLNKLFIKKSSSKKIQKKINIIGQNILKNTYQELNILLKNEI